MIITGAGGAPSTNFVRSIRLAPEPFHLIGVDCDNYYLQRAETNEKYLAPPCSDPDYIPFFTALIQETGAEFVVAQPDVEIAVLSAARDQLPCRSYWPSQESIRICQDKFLSYEAWARAGIRVPKTMMLRDEADLQRAFAELGRSIWIRNISGAFGKGSLPTSEFDQAKAWLDFQRGWGSFCAAERLSDRSITWQSIWKDGELVVAQTRLRLYWEFANRAPSGVTVSDPAASDLAIRAIHAIDTRPHGVWSVDFTNDKDGCPNPTEINIGRFFTTHLFFSQAGLNMPYILVKLAFDEEPPLPERRINPLPDGLAWIRGMDIVPLLTTTTEIERKVEEFNARREALRTAR